MHDGSRNSNVCIKAKRSGSNTKLVAVNLFFYSTGYKLWLFFMKDDLLNFKLKYIYDDSIIHSIWVKGPFHKTLRIDAYFLGENGNKEERKTQITI